MRVKINQKFGLAGLAMGGALFSASTDANALATFHGSLNVTLIMPHAEANLFGYGGPGVSKWGFAPAAEVAQKSGNANGKAVNGKFTTSGERLRAGTFTVDGWSAPTGHFNGSAGGRIEVNLENLTGSGGNSLPAQNVTETITVMISGYLSAGAWCHKSDESSGVGVEAAIALNGSTISTNPDGEQTTCNDPRHRIFYSYPLPVTLPPHSVSSLTADISVNGDAGSTPHFKVPEPGSAALLLSGLLGACLLGFPCSLVRGRRKTT